MINIDHIIRGFNDAFEELDFFFPEMFDSERIALMKKLEKMKDIEENEDEEQHIGGQNEQ